MFCINERGESAFLLCFCNAVHRQRCLTGRFRSVDLCNPAAWYPSDAQGQIQAKGKVPVGGTAHIVTFQRDLLNVHPTVKVDEIAYAGASGQFEKLVELRSNRLVKVTSGIPNLLWTVLLIGAAFTVAIIWMLDMEIVVHAILTAVLSMFLGISSAGWIPSRERKP